MRVSSILLRKPFVRKQPTGCSLRAALIATAILRKPFVRKQPTGCSLRAALIATAVLFILIACQNPTGNKALPQAQNPKEVAVGFIDMLRQNHCEIAFSFVSGTLKNTYQKMIDAKGLSLACESWREYYLPYSSVEYSFEEEVSTNRKKVWLKLYKDVNGVYTVISIVVENKSGRWWVVAV